MANFTVRVELHDATDDEYEELHGEMKDRGFVRWIVGSDDVKKRLPTAEYNLVGSDLTVSEVRDKAVEAAEAVKPSPKPWVLVSESVRRRWSGLKKW